MLLDVVVQHSVFLCSIVSALSMKQHVPSRECEPNGKVELANQCYLTGMKVSPRACDIIGCMSES